MFLTEHVYKTLLVTAHELFPDSNNIQIICPAPGIKPKFNQYFIWSQQLRHFDKKQHYMNIAKILPLECLKYAPHISNNVSALSLYKMVQYCLSKSTKTLPLYTL